jgi:hypothetical protein
VSLIRSFAIRRLFNGAWIARFHDRTSALTNR